MYARPRRRLGVRSSVVTKAEIFGGSDQPSPEATSDGDAVYTMTETLMVRCPSCGGAFATELQVDRATLEALVLTKVYECPQCGAVATYFKADHFHQLDVTEKHPT
jgi:predicted RNA-binding Zn-ribbon protein involved in translation (DUF1610 family)